MSFEMDVGSRGESSFAKSMETGSFDPDRRVDIRSSAESIGDTFDPDRRIDPEARKDETESKVDMPSLINEYLDDVKARSDCPETIPDRTFTASDISVRTPEENSMLREEFRALKEKLIVQWEKMNNREWPRYEKDVYVDGVLVRKAGWRYDAHHLQPLKLGGKNEASNITPLRYDDHQNVHREDGPCSRLTQVAKGEMR